MSDTEDAAAPIFDVPDREVVALEHPMIIQNLENAIKTFGTNRPFLRVLDSADPEQCIPLYLRYNDPMCVPILSHNSPTNNVLLKITVPKRTGRKRKRGSDAPFAYPNEESSTTEGGRKSLGNEDPNLESQSGRIKTSSLLRKVIDNRDTYKVEVVAEIRQTHRYRGLSDFHHSTSQTEFIPKFTDQLLSGDIEKLRMFKFNPSRGWKPNEEFIPAPKMTNHTIPQNWGWHQNSNIHREFEAKTGQDILVNRSKPRKVQVEYLRFNVASIPQESPFEIPDDERLQEIVADLTEAFNERPIWSRRALHNRLCESRVRHLMRAGLQHIGYQFKGGPFRECVIKYGLDPRTDPKYRKYQTIFFKVYEDQRNTGMMWHDLRSTYSLSRQAAKGPVDGHLFDGKKVTLDGKVWQLCDITDPLLVSLINNAPCAKNFEIKADGWYLNGSMAKIRGIMRAKILAIWRKKEITDADFAAALEVPDEIPGRRSAQLQIPLPIDGLTAEELEKLEQRGVPSVIEENGIRRKIHKGKMRSQRIRSHVGVRKEDKRWTKIAKFMKSNATSAINDLAENQKHGTNVRTTTSSDPNLTETNQHDEVNSDEHATGHVGVDCDEDGQSLEEGDSEQDSDMDEVELDEGEDEDDEDEDDEEGLESIPAPILRRPNSHGSTSSATTPVSMNSGPVVSTSLQHAPGRSKSINSATSKPRSVKPRTKRAPSQSGAGSGTSSVNGHRFTPAQIDLSMYKNIAPRPPPS